MKKINFEDVELTGLYEQAREKIRTVTKAHLKNRRVECNPFLTLIFETKELVLNDLQEHMRHFAIEKMDAAHREILDRFNFLIPEHGKLTALIIATATDENDLKDDLNQGLLKDIGLSLRFGKFVVHGEVFTHLQGHPLPGKVVKFKFTNKEREAFKDEATIESFIGNVKSEFKLTQAQLKELKSDLED